MNTIIRENSLKSLGGWCDDAIIHAYLGLLSKLSAVQIYVIPSFVHNKWLNDNFNEWLYEKVIFPSLIMKFMKVRSEEVIEDKNLKLGWSSRHYAQSNQTDGISCGIFLLMNAEAIGNGVTPKIMRQQQCDIFRSYVSSRILHYSSRNCNETCEMPFCSEPTKKDVKWIQCAST
ncbi:uncharacterized protein LOC141907758 [Tubulanus polymorphus]|uniref:uncharacterized protein LOC141907758 n=1 Tax=Tubulanus polymorphus TaxID=672921 RepID=UPI003DA58DCC